MAPISAQRDGAFARFRRTMSKPNTNLPRAKSLNMGDIDTMLMPPPSTPLKGSHGRSVSQHVKRSI